MAQLSQDSLVTILLCSDLGLSKDFKERYKPYTIAQWNKLADKIINSPLKKPSALLNIEKEVLKKDLHLTEEEIDRIQALIKRGGNIAIEIEKLESKGILITTRADESYPQRLKKVLKKNSPPILFYSGDIRLASKLSIAIVGSRDVDEHGIVFTRELAKRCVKEGHVIVSGGAKGVDTIAEQIAIQEKGFAVAIVSDGLNKKIKEKSVRNAILEGKLLVMSAVNPDAKFSVYAAMDRNKYIYALSQYTVAVSSSLNKGGTWTGALENIKKNWVPLFIRDGEKVPQGNKKLIELGGKPIGIEVLEDKDIVIKEWFLKNVSNDKKEEQTHQLTLNMYKSSKENSTKVMEEEHIDKDVMEKIEVKEKEKNLDVYPLILSYMKEALEEPKNQEELSKVLNVNKVQLNQWLKRATEENEIVKLTKPLRYALKN